MSSPKSPTSTRGAPPTGWLAAIADYNPVTYLLAGLRSVTSEGWVIGDILAALGAIALVGVVSQSLAFAALRSRVRSS